MSSFLKGKSMYGDFGLGAMFKMLIAALIIIPILLIQNVYMWLFKPAEIKSKVRIQPEVVLTTDGKKVDSLFIYREK